MMEINDGQLAWIRGCCVARLRKNEKEHRKLRARSEQPDDRFMDFLERRALALAFARETIDVLTAELVLRGREDLLEPLAKGRA